MRDNMRVMTTKPLNAETPTKYLRSWVTANEVFFDRNQGQIPGEKIALDQWALTIDGEVETPLRLTFDQIGRRPKTIVANTLECSGNGRSLLAAKAPGNPWTIGGVGNAVWGGVALSVLLDEAGLGRRAAHVAFEGMDTPLGKAQIAFVRSIPIAKAMTSTLLAYEMNGAPLPLKHGYPLRALALGWTGASCVKWLKRITVLEKPHEGFFMDKVYRVFQKGQDPKTGDIVTGIKIKSIITQPLTGEQCPAGRIVVLGAAYAGEDRVARVEVSTDDGSTWRPAEFIGPDAPYAWRQWQYIWEAVAPGDFTLRSRATDSRGIRQPAKAAWNFLGYGNNGVEAHAVTIEVK
jgi:DMSO/TMAO reductase YedYZ molybdopterin-dependent catalytic subunit